MPNEFTSPSPRKYAPIIFGAALLAFGCLIAAVIASGQTFGQRCKAQGFSEGAELSQCVHALSQGSGESQR